LIFLQDINSSVFNMMRIATSGFFVWMIMLFDSVNLTKSMYMSDTSMFSNSLLRLSSSLNFGFILQNNIRIVLAAVSVRLSLMVTLSFSSTTTLLFPWCFCRSSIMSDKVAGLLQLARVGCYNYVFFFKLCWFLPWKPWIYKKT
jgi:hypothetical protein